MRPLARRDGLLQQNVGEQQVVFDQRHRRLHVLSRSAALVWQHCDGHRDVAQLAEIIGRELGAPVNNDVILLALQKLDEARLLKAPQESTPLTHTVSRREMMSRAVGGLASAVLLPVVTSCGSIVESAIGPATRGNVSSLVETTTSSTTTPFSTTTSTTTPFSTTTSTTTPFSTTTSTTTPFSTTTSTTTPFSTTTSTTTPGTTTSTTTTVATTTTPPPKKVQVCHKGNTIEVDARAVAAHLAHGDTLGACPG